jgi:hypothetical protein
LGIVDDAKCYEVVRQLRRPDGVRCPHCDAAHVVKQGRDEAQSDRDDSHKMTTQLRQGGVQRKPKFVLSREFEYDEASAVAGHKGRQKT